MKTGHVGLHRYIYLPMVGCFCGAFLTLGIAIASTINMTIDHLIDVCAAPSTNEAMIKGDKLGWQRITMDELKEWREQFLGYAGGQVDLIGWRREERTGADTLKYLSTGGPAGKRTCLYSTKNASGIFNLLSERLGAPQEVETNKAAENTTAWWVKDELEYSLVQVGLSAIVTVSSRR